jgi:hypothetical protein
MALPKKALACALSAAELGMHDAGLWQQFASIVREARQEGWELVVSRKEA